MSRSDPATGPAASPRACAERSAYSTSISSSRWSSSARSFDRYLAKPKKSSARRKKPRWVGRRHASLSFRASARCAPSVASASTLSLPTTGRPAAAAIASSSVDFPEPFSPTKNVTRAEQSRRSSVATAGTEKGNSSPASDDFGATLARKLIACRAPSRSAGGRRRRADVAQRAVGALRLAGVADAAAVEDQEVRQHRPAVAREERHQRLLDLDRVGLPR